MNKYGIKVGKLALGSNLVATRQTFGMKADLV